MRTVHVWDFCVRFTHWMVAFLVIASLFNDSGKIWHRYIGYAAFGLVISRLIWAGLSSGYASFRSWWPSIADCIVYGRMLLSGKRPKFYLGHNPLGAFMALLLWGLTLALGISGWMMGLDRFWGEEWPEFIHAMLADLLRVAIVAHIMGILI